MLNFYLYFCIIKHTSSKILSIVMHLYLNNNIIIITLIKY